jgi:hypothetical protein
LLRAAGCESALAAWLAGARVSSRAATTAVVRPFVEAAGKREIESLLVFIGYS